MAGGESRRLPYFLLVIGRKRLGVIKTPATFYLGAGNAMDLAMTALIVSLGGLLLQFVGLIVAAVWVVGKIQGTTEKLGQAIEHLAANLEALTKWTSRVDKTVDAHGERLATVEAIQQRKRS